MLSSAWGVGALPLGQDAAIVSRETDIPLSPTNLQTPNSLPTADVASYKSMTPPETPLYCTHVELRNALDLPSGLRGLFRFRSHTGGPVYVLDCIFVGWAYIPVLL